MNEVEGRLGGCGDGKGGEGGWGGRVVLGWLAKEDMESVWWDFPFDTGHCFDNLDEVGHWTPKGLGTNWSLDIKFLSYLHSCESLRTGGGGGEAKRISSMSKNSMQPPSRSER